LPYEAGDGGQRIRLSLSGVALDKLSVLSDGVEVPLENGEFTLTVAQGRKQVSFAIQADDDLTESGAVSVSATLVDAAGVATHQTHLEANLQLQHEAPVFDTTAMTFFEILSDGSFFPGRVRAQLLGTAGPDIVFGDHSSDSIDAGAGNNLIMEAPHPTSQLPDDPYHAADRIRSGDGTDIVSGYLGAQVDVGDGDNFVQANYVVGMRTFLVDDNGSYIQIFGTGLYPGSPYLLMDVKRLTQYSTISARSRST
jgi:hypothetical protein